MMPSTLAGRCACGRPLTVLQTLTVALDAARSAALSAVGTPDGGTSNFDTCTIPITRSTPRKALAQAAESVGIRGEAMRWLGEQYFFLHLGAGQAQRRTAMVEAAAAALRIRGVPAVVYYHSPRNPWSVSSKTWHGTHRRENPGNGEALPGEGDKP